MNTTSIALDTIGCKLNQAETESLTRSLVLAGYKVVTSNDNPDVYILNTCSVTHIADRKSRQLLRSAKRRNPNTFVIATGCYAQRDATKIGTMNEVNMVIDNSQKDNIVELLHLRGFLPAGNQIQNHSYRTRSTIKIQDGCDQYCSYCIVPFTRGLGYSIPVNKVLAEVHCRVKDNFNEIILTGTQIGCYDNLVELVQRILKETNIQRLRLSSLQPQDISPQLLQLWSDSRLCRHLHLPLQSGTDVILKKMRRRYSISEYERALSIARNTIPGLSITTDLIVGFPGESDTQFEESLHFCERSGFSRIHVFPYSPRPGTSATEMSDRVQPEIIKERSKIMVSLSKKLSLSFIKKFVGHTMVVLWEEKQNNYKVGLTDNYIRVYTEHNESLSNQLLPIKITSCYKDGAWGELVNNLNSMST